MKKLVFLFAQVVLMVFAMHTVQAQSKTISGIVKSASDGSPIPGVTITVKGTTKGTSTDVDGKFSMQVPNEKAILIFSFVGFVTEEIAVKNKNYLEVQLHPDVSNLQEVVVTGYGRHHRVKKSEIVYDMEMNQPSVGAYHHPHWHHQPVPQESEEYNGLPENTFQEAKSNPLSTFSIDVDAASYSNIRRFINQGQLPDKDAVRIEEMINYFDYDYPQPKGNDPFSISLEVSNAPWNSKHQLVHIGLKGKEIPLESLPPSNLVFLIDVSGSMSPANRLPLLKSAFKMLVDQLREEDKVSIVVYAGAAGCVLPATSGAEKKKIKQAIDNLSAGGSTAGGAGIQLAYQIAKENYLDKGNNRVILATDGDFNVGVSSAEGLEKLIESKRNEGVFLTVLGFGMGNYKDARLETLADKGNGNYAYIDNFQEAKKVFVHEFAGTMYTIAKDVKIQVEFNPANVAAYRLIGYENRKLKAEDFNNDKKDAGELGSGHTVTALYEVIPVGVESYFQPIDPLKYQNKKQEQSTEKYSDELLTVKFRYKEPNGDKSKLIVKSLSNKTLPISRTSENFRWSAAVAIFGMLLTDSQYLQEGDYELVHSLAQSARGKDEKGYRIEFINLVSSSQLMVKN